jgi:hypothetical protein
MFTYLHKLLLIVSLIFLSGLAFAENSKTMPHHFSGKRLIGMAKEKETASIGIKHNIKICTCQILILESSYHRQRNFALFAERTNKKSLAADLSSANRVIEREKRRMRSLFYDKLEVQAIVADVTDCKSLYKKLKIENKALYLYDILDADIRR